MKHNLKYISGRFEAQLIICQKSFGWFCVLFSVYIHLYRVLYMLISFYLRPYKQVTISFKNFPATNRPDCIWKLLCVSVDEPLVPCISFSILPILYQMWKAYINLTTFEEYLWQLESAQTEGQADRQAEWINIFQLCRKLLKTIEHNWKYIFSRFEA